MMSEQLRNWLQSRSRLPAVSACLLSSWALGAALMAHAPGASGSECMIPAAVTAALASPSRPAADVQLDVERKPAQLLAFAGIKPGDRVADLIPGNGYFTRLFQALVGPKGHVYAVVPVSLVERDVKRLDPIKAILSAEGGKTTSLLVKPYGDIGADAPLDVVWTSQNYHDVYGAVGPFAAATQSGDEAAEALDNAAFRALKPGGVFVVIDHAAKPGAGASSAKALHRMDVDIVIAQARAAGFTLTERWDGLANPADSHEAMIFAPEIKGHTDKFALKFVKQRPDPHAKRNCP
jgi:predicted methyltransferase